MITLSGTISASDLNSNFNEELAAMATNMARSGKDLQYDLDVRDILSTTDISLRSMDFVAPAQLELRAVSVVVWNPDATPRVVTGTLTAVDDSGTAVPKYLLNQTVSVSVTANSAAEFTGTRANYQTSTGTKIFLNKGVVYRLTLSVDVASAVDRAVLTIVCRNRWRRQ